MKALFFLRHYNDIDHVTPVVHQWSQAGHGADVVLMGERSYIDDYRLQYLAKLPGLSIAWIGDILSAPQMARMKLQKLLLDRNVRAAMPAVAYRGLTKILSETKRAQFWRAIATLVLDRSFAAGERGVIAFDWISGNSVFPIEFVRTVVASAQQRGLGAVSLPHGDSPHANYLVRTDEFSMAPRQKFSPASMFDAVAVPNELCAARFRPFVDYDRVAVLGSPRYCDAWLRKLAELLPPSPLSTNPETLKLVMFLRKSDFSIFWEEVGRVVWMLSQFPRVELIVKAHTRGGWRQPLFKDRSLQQLANVRFVADEIHSSHLLAWSDAVIDIATSVAFEAVKLGKPVLAADYLHASTSTVASYIPDCAWQCRDDAHRSVEKLLEHGTVGFYPPEQRSRFLREIVDVPSPDVLPRYVALLERCASSE